MDGAPDLIAQMVSRIAPLFINSTSAVQPHGDVAIGLALLPAIQRN